MLWLSSKKKIVKGILHPKIAILSSFIHQHVVPNLYEFLSAVEHKRKNFEKCLRAFFHTMEVKGLQHCVVPTKERKLYRFGMIFRWNTPLNSAFITMFFIVMSIQIRFFFYSFTSCIFQKYRFTVVNYLLLQCKQLLKHSCSSNSTARSRVQFPENAWTDKYLETPYLEMVSK